MRDGSCGADLDVDSFLVEEGLEENEDLREDRARGKLLMELSESHGV